MAATGELLVAADSLMDQFAAEGGTLPAGELAACLDRACGQPGRHAGLTTFAPSPPRAIYDRIATVLRRPLAVISWHPVRYADGYLDHYLNPYRDGYAGDRVPVDAALSPLPQLSTLAGPGHAQRARVTRPRFAT